jgi:hypothetical protein
MARSDCNEAQSLIKGYIMKARKLILLAATTMLAMSASIASANDKWLGNRGDNWQDHIKSTKTRAEVIAELNEARAQGLVRGGTMHDYPHGPVAKSTRTRDEVRAEMIEAAKNGTRTVDYTSGQ